MLSATKVLAKAYFDTSTLRKCQIVHFFWDKLTYVVNYCVIAVVVTLQQSYLLW